jgi:HEAT repeat protein
MNRVWLLAFSWISLAGFAEAPARSSHLARRIQCWHQLGLVDQAQCELEAWIAQDTDCVDAWGHMAIVRARKGDHIGLAQALERFQRLGPEQRLADHVLEEVAWASLQEGCRQGTLSQRVGALLGQMVTRDTRALPALHAALEDASPVMRAIAAQLVTLCWDAETSIRLEKRLQIEQQPDVRKALIRALGQCGTPFSLQTLLEAVEKTDPQEQLAALESVSNHLGEVPVQIVETCLRHPRSGMRALGAHLALHLKKPVALNALINLMKDPQAAVRSAAWQSLASLNPGPMGWKKLIPFWEKIREERDPSIAAVAAGLALRHAPEQATPYLLEAIFGDHRKRGLQALQGVLKSGPAGLKILQDVAATHPDRLMRMNACVGCLAHRHQLSHHLAQLLEELQQLDERIMPLRSAGLATIGPSEIGHVPGVANLPEAMDLMARLRLSHLIRAVGGPLPTEQLARWLDETRWSLSAASAQMLLSEGDAQAAQMVKNILDHANPKVRLQAALVLAIVGKDEEALEHLVQAAQTGDMEIELQVMDAAGSLGSRVFLPFLSKKLADPSPQIRQVAASSLLQILAESSRV